MAQAGGSSKCEEEEMSKEVSKNDLAAWDELSKSHRRFIKARMAFYQSEVDRVELIRRAMHTNDQALALSLARYLSPTEHMQLFDEWVYWATIDSCLPAVHNYILSLPKEWIMGRIEEAVELRLREGDEIDFRRYLELFCNLDRDLAAKLARRALEHSDKEIQDAGRDYLSALEGDQG
jgi:hypothetical protein